MADVSHAARNFTPKQGQYLAFSHLYTRLHRQPPAETDMQEFFRQPAFGSPNGADARTRGGSSEGNQGAPAASKCSLIQNTCQNYFEPNSTCHNHCAAVLGVWSHGIVVYCFTLLYGGLNESGP